MQHGENLTMIYKQARPGQVRALSLKILGKKKASKFLAKKRPQNFGQNLDIDIENNILITYILLVELVNERPHILVSGSTLDNHTKI